jgi:hypothetical protein|nr:MAG TPA: hypothetical protein [Caudoviricetes sp.]
MMTDNPNLIDPTPYEMSALVQWYIDLRAHKSEIEASIKPALAHTKQQMQAIEAELTKRLQQVDSEAMRTTNGTVSKTTKTKYAVVDAFAFRQWMAKNPEIASQLVSGQVTPSEVSSYLADGGKLPDGLAIEKEYTISVRKS